MPYIFPVFRPYYPPSPLCGQTNTENIKEETQYDEEDSGDDAGNGVNSGICGLRAPEHTCPQPQPGGGSYKVKTAIKEKYPEATIKTVTFATYENQQLYKILLQKTENDTTEEVYVTANGAIIPAKATAAATPGVSPAGTAAPAKKK